MKQMNVSQKSLAAAWREQADAMMRTSKAYNCRSMAERRHGCIVGAATLRSCADQLEALYAQGVEQGEGAQDADGQAVAESVMPRKPKRKHA